MSEFRKKPVVIEAMQFPRANHLVSEDEPSVIGAGCGRSPTPGRSEAEAIWRRLYVDRMVACGIDRESAQACCEAGDADLSLNPADAADDEMQYWVNDDEVTKR